MGLALALSLGSRRPRIFDSLIHSAEPYCCPFCAGSRGQREESGTVLTFREFRTQQKKPIFIKKLLLIPGKKDRERIHTDLALKEFTA